MTLRSAEMGSTIHTFWTANNPKNIWSVKSAVTIIGKKFAFWAPAQPKVQLWKICPLKKTRVFVGGRCSGESVRNGGREKMEGNRGSIKTCSVRINTLAVCYFVDPGLLK